MTCPIPFATAAGMNLRDFAFAKFLSMTKFYVSVFYDKNIKNHITFSYCMIRCVIIFCRGYRLCIL